ncbi:MAG: hypothetical protein ACHQLQ_10080 [Candidatus Acidiferrales bacterium]
MQILKAGTLYFALVFGAGFALGTIRTLWVVPSVGIRKAELMEEPLMLVITFLAARWVVRRLSLPPRALTQLGMGMVGLGFLVAAELGFVLWLRGMTIREYVASRDPVAGMVYLGMLGVFAVMPLIVAGGRVGNGNVGGEDGSKNAAG